MLKETISEFLDDNSPRLAAALAYYTVFSLPPLLVLVLMVTGVFVDAGDVRGAIERQMQGVIGAEAARSIQMIFSSAERPGSGGTAATLLSIGALAFGATGAFVELQTALNTVWEVRPDPRTGGVRNFIFKRAFSFGMVLAVAFLLLVSLVLSAALSAFGERLASLLPGTVSEVALRALDLGLSLVFITALFATMFKVLPDARIAWRDVWVGAAVTSLLFVAGKFAIGVYVGRSDPGSTFGAAGSLAVMLVWIYFTGMILLLGAEFTQVWARRHGRGIEPEAGAVRVVQVEKRVPT
jgi:membrane protein